MAFFIGAFSSSPASAADDAGLYAQVQKLIEAWNKGDMAAVTKGVAPSLSIIDEFPPYSWSGKDGLKNYLRDYAAVLKSHNVTDPVFTLSQRPTIDEVHGTHAYIVAHGVNSFKENGKAIVETGVMTLALDKVGDDWVVTSSAWSKD
jgi:hypothetical protein